MHLNRYVKYYYYIINQSFDTFFLKIVYLKKISIYNTIMCSIFMLIAKIFYIKLLFVTESNIRVNNRVRTFTATSLI